jgi:hypothetical protein
VNVTAPLRLGPAGNGYWVDFCEAAPRVKRSLRVRCPTLPPSNPPLELEEPYGMEIYGRSPSEPRRGCKDCKG